MVSDQQLARLPIIVVAQWEKAPRILDESGSDDAVVETKLRILRTVKGPKVEAEVVDVALGRQIVWAEDGRALNSATSSWVPGAVADITEPSLWFLKVRVPSDQVSRKEQFFVESYRMVQPLELEPYFLALGGENPMADVPQLLTPNQPILAKQVLKFIAGGRSTWPQSQNPDDFYPPQLTPSQVLTTESDRVWRLVESDAQSIRPIAVSVYANLLGADCVSNLRTLLDDADSNVRGTALGILTKYRDVASLERSEEVMKTIDNAILRCSIIREMSRWGDERTIPALIECLQFVGSPRWLGEDSTPALKARAVLHQITGCWFPLDVTRSLEAWRTAESQSHAEDRYARLSVLLNEPEFPLVAKIFGEPIYNTQLSGTDAVAVQIQIRNISQHIRTISKKPFHTSIFTPGALLGAGEAIDGNELRSSDLISISPGETYELQVSVGQSFIDTDSALSRLEITFHSRQIILDANCWIGTLVVGYASRD